MLPSRIVLLAVAITLPMAAVHAVPYVPKSEIKDENKLIGTWKYVSGKYNGQENKLPDGITMLKHVTSSQFTWVVYDKDGKVSASLGGSCTLTGDKYVEIPEYGFGDAFEQLKGKSQEFTWKLDGNKWFHNGKLSSGLTIEEVWERVEKK